MYLVILNGAVTGIYRDEPTDIPEGAELAEWDGPPPALEWEEVGGVRIPTIPQDPRDAQHKLISAKRRKVKEINAWDEGIRLAGAAFGPYLMRFDEYGQRRLATLLTTVRELFDQGKITANTLIPIWDVTDTKQRIKASDFRAAVVAFFNSCQAQEEAVGDLLQAVKAATTIEEVNSIVVG